MNWKDIRWGAAVGGFLVAEIGLFASAFGWVGVYSYLVNPGQTPAFYQGYAQVASPWVSLIAGTPLFYFVCRWIATKAPARAWPTAMALFGLFFLVDLALVLAMGALTSPRLLGFVAASHVLKFLACHFGARSAARRIVTPA